MVVMIAAIVTRLPKQPRMELIVTYILTKRIQDGGTYNQVNVSEVSPMFVTFDEAFSDDSLSMTDFPIKAAMLSISHLTLCPSHLPFPFKACVAFQINISQAVPV